MPELPDVTVYLEALGRFVVGRTLAAVRVRSPSLVRTYDPPLREVNGRGVTGVRRIGKRIVLAVEGDLFLVLHLMVAGRLRWRKPGAAVPRKGGHAAFDFRSAEDGAPHGTLLLTEASTRKRAALHLVRGEAALGAHDPCGLEVMDCGPEAFVAALRARNHTLKRFLTDPRILSGIGNAYSDEILHRARLSPVQRTANLSDDDVMRLFDAVRTTLADWTERLRAEVGEGFPEKVTAFREGMAVHGRFRQPCPDCGAPVQRIRYAEREVNYCAGCQTGGRILADRALSRLLREDWPRTLEEMERLPGRRQDTGG